MHLNRLSLPLRITLISLIITLGGVVSIALMAYHYSDQLLEEEELNSLHQQVEREAATIRQKLKTILEDAHFLNASDPVRGIARALRNDGYDDQENMTLFLWKNRLAKLFTTVMTQRDIYSQMRLIQNNETGDELVRVDRINNEVQIIPHNRLQQKGHRDYFQSGLKLKPGEFYISKISLNREHGQVTFPPTPMLRVVMPVFDKQNKLFALLVINANLHKIANNLYRTPKGQFFFIANQNGDYLIHPDTQKEMAFEYDRLASLQTDYPALRALIGKLKTTHQLPKQIFSLPEQGIGLALELIHYYPGHPERFMLIGGVESLSALKEKSAHLRDQLLLVVLLTSLILALVTFLLVRHITRPLQLLKQAVDAVRAGKDQTPIPQLDGPGEIASLARSFDDMLKRLSASQKALKTANEDLEHQVAQRTAELQEAKQFLERQNKQLARALEQAKAADQAKSRFLAMMSHEIRTPLNGILGLTELALQQDDLPEKVRENLQAVHDSGHTLLTILNDVLDYSKIEAGQFKLHPHPTDINMLLEQVVRLYGTMAEKKTLELLLHPCVHLQHQVHADGDRLRQILMNLMSNAIKFTDEGFVTLRCHLLEETAANITLYFEISDTGIGISPEDQNKLFKEFSWVDNSYARKHGGTGLGLSIAHRLVKMMGGELKVESTVGQGSRFYFQLTFKKSDPLQNTPNTYHAVFQQHKLLAYSPYAPARAIWKEVLTHWGLELTLCENLQALKDAIEHTEHYDSILVDMAYHSAAELKPVTQCKLPCIALKQRDTQLACTHTLLKPLLYSQLLSLLLELWGETQHTPSAQRAHSASDSSELSHLHVLVVEDVAVNQQVILGMLRQLGIKQVELAQNGMEAVKKFACGRYDLILMDLQMPEMDGYTALKAIRTHEQTNDCPPTPIIALTAHALSEERENALKAGFNDMLTKPVSMQQLKTLLETVRPAIEEATLPPTLDPDVLQTLQQQVGELATLIEVYLDDFPQLEAQLTEAWRTQAFDKLAKLAHRLKGASHNMGALRLGALCKQLEQAAKQNHTQEVDLLMPQLIDTMRDTQQILKHYQEQNA